MTSRRGFIQTLTAATAGVVAAPLVADTAVAASPPIGTRAACAPVPELATLRRGDPRYQELVTRGFNGRFVADPDKIHLVHSSEQIVRVVEQAVRAGEKISLRSGGHCFDNLVDNPQTRAIIDMAAMREICYDSGLRAFSVQAGATLAEVYRTLYWNWGVTIPAGVCPQVGIGGHIAGGGYGPLTRRDGITIDHVYGVEVVVVDQNGKAQTVIATRDSPEPLRGLWWAHTGGGGGSYGVVTRYLFRTPGRSGTDPSKLLPKPPASLQTSHTSWSWADLDEAKFVRLVRNYGAWYEADTPGSKYASLYSTLHLNTAAVGELTLETRFDGTRADSRQLIENYVGAINEGVGPDRQVSHTDGLWLQVTNGAVFDTGGYDRSKTKGAYLRRGWSEERAATVHRHLTDPAFDGWGAVDLYSYGGQVNTVAPNATAVPQRDSILKAWFSATWMDPAADGKHLDWIRRFYRDVFADTGGVPAPSADHDGSFINYPDTDLRDPAWNTSDTAWSGLYWKDNYARLQEVKKQWDPGNVFKHPLSIELPR